MTNKIRILHIDDNLHDRLLVKDALRNENDDFEVVEAESRQKFEKLISEQDFDIVLSDFNILGFDGLQVLQIIKEKRPDIPVIIVTGTGSEEVAVQAMKSGADDYVIKSVKHIMSLEPTIRKVIENMSIKREHQKALVALKESEERFRLIFSYSLDGVMLTTPEGMIIRANSAACQMFGRSEEELKSMGRFGLVDISDQRLRNAIEERNHTGKFKGELTGLRSDGSHFPIEVSSALFTDSEGNIRASVILRDITVRKETESLLLQKSKKIEAQNEELLKTNEELQLAIDRAEISDRLKTAFLHNISHEIRTPLNAIVGFSGLLNEKTLDPEKRNLFTEIIHQNSDQLLSIISDIVNIANIEVGLEKAIEKETNLSTTLLAIHNKFLKRAQKQNITFTLDKSSSIGEEIILTDELKLTKILSNLIDNALKFTKQGTINFGYIFKDNTLEFFVEDTGIGIPEEMHSEIFKHFRQAENNSIPKFSGSGLGLSISKAYVELLGGKIWLKSKLDEGSIFYFTIPYKKVDNQQKQITLADQKSGYEICQSKTILVAEDEDSNYHLVQEFLSELGVNILWAVNGIDAVDMCKKCQEIDLVLMDIKMPVMDGFEAMIKIKKFRPDLPIIAQSAYTSDADIERFYKYGFNGFIGKPLRKDLLIEIILEQF